LRSCSRCFQAGKFAPIDTVIVNGLHGALLLAPRHPAGFGSVTNWVSNLAGFEIELLRDGAVVDRGRAANVLDGPLSALRHLVDLLARDPSSLSRRPWPIYICPPCGASMTPFEFLAAAAGAQLVPANLALRSRPFDTLAA
jgi:hypothetical protein